MHDLSLPTLQEQRVLCRLPLTAADCLQRAEVWCAHLVQPAVLQEACLAILSSEEVERTRRFLVEAPRTRYLLSHAALRLVLAHRQNVRPDQLQFRESPKGKPYLVTSPDSPLPVHFNLSHSGDVALIATASDRELGVDVEKLESRRAARDVADRFFAGPEKQLLSTLTGQEMVHAFFRIWTRKEAVLKATGAGITSGLARLDVSVNATTEASSDGFVVQSEGARWRVFDLAPAPGYLGALAVRAECETRKSGTVCAMDER